MIEHLCNKGGKRAGRWMGLLMACCLMIGGLMALPSASLGQIPGAAKSADDGSIQQYQPAIKKYVSEQMATMLGTDVAAQEKSRDALISQVGGRETTTSVPFQYAFSSEINAQVVAAMGTADLRAKLNMGVLVASVAEAVNNDRLDGATRALLKDKTLAVRIWGLKASQFVLPALFRNPMTSRNPAMLADIVAATEAAPPDAVGSGAAYRAAYLSLSLGVNPTSNKRPDLNAATQTIPLVLELFQNRVKMMREKGTIDDAPADAKTATFFLTHPNVWDMLTPDQQVATVQSMSDMIWLVAQKAAKSDAKQAGLLWPYIKEAANQFWVIGDRVKSVELRDSVKLAQRVGDRVSGDEFLSVTQGIFPVLQKLQQFSSLTPPPTLPETPASDDASAGNN